MSSELVALTRAVVADALAAVEPGADDALVETRVRGYFQRHWRRLAPFGATRESLRGLVVRSLTLDGGGFYGPSHRVYVDYSLTPLAGR